MKHLQSEESCLSPVLKAEEAEAEAGDPAAKRGQGAEDATLASGAYQDTVVVAHRGSCMFEEKAIAAQGAGAEAVIIVNSEVSCGLL